MKYKISNPYLGISILTDVKITDSKAKELGLSHLKKYGIKSAKIGGIKREKQKNTFITIVHFELEGKE